MSTDTTGLVSFSWNTRAGYGYGVETSVDLAAWQPLASLHGNGGTVALPVAQIVPPGQPDPPPTQANPLDSAHFTAEKGDIGQLIAHDTPSRTAHDWLSADQLHPPIPDDRLHCRIWFRDFARVQIGSQWYLASEYHPWRFAMFLSRSSGTWQPEAAEIFDLTNDELP